MKKNQIVDTKKAVLGQALVEQAKQRLEKTEQESVQKEVDDILRRIQECHDSTILMSNRLTFFCQQQEALEKGKFTVEGWTGRRKIVYDDPKLNKDCQ